MLHKQKTRAKMQYEKRKNKAKELYPLRTKAQDINSYDAHAHMYESYVHNLNVAKCYKVSVFKC